MKREREKIVSLTITIYTRLKGRGTRRIYTHHKHTDTLIYLVKSRNVHRCSSRKRQGQFRILSTFRGHSQVGIYREVVNDFISRIRVYYTPCIYTIPAEAAASVSSSSSSSLVVTGPTGLFSFFPPTSILLFIFRLFYSMYCTYRKVPLCSPKDIQRSVSPLGSFPSCFFFLRTLAYDSSLG